MTVVETAERKARLRALAFYGVAATILVLELIQSGQPKRSFVHGLWAGLTGTSALYLVPYASWLKPNSAVARLLDDESAREHRRMATTCGFWAALISALILVAVTGATDAVSAAEAVRVIASAAMIAALGSFATLELRAQR